MPNAHDFRRASATPSGREFCFAEFERQGVRYCVLRTHEPSQAAAGIPEVDLLVDRRQLRLLARILEENGYRPLLSWGNAPHSFFIGFDPSRGGWLKFDVVTDIRYGEPIRALSSGLAKNCLRHRRRQASVYVLAPENELIKLLLHCLLHVRDFEARDRSRMNALWRELERAPRLRARTVRMFERLVAPAISWTMFEQAMDTQDWSALMNRRRAVVHHLFWRDPLRAVGRYLSGRILRLVRPVWIAARLRGVSIALLGSDGAGKTTLARALAGDPFLRARTLYMGTNPAASTVSLVAEGRLHAWARRTEQQRQIFLHALGKTIAFACRLLDQWFRYAVARYHLRRGRFVVFDRFIYDPDPDQSAAKRFRRWLLQAGHPRPDLVVLLDAPAAVLRGRKDEHSLTKLRRQREAYLRLKEQLPQIIVLDTTCSEDQVRREVVQLLWRHYQLRIHG